MSPTPQTPPTDRPLTAGDVPLLREGDVLRFNPGDTEALFVGLEEDAARRWRIRWKPRPLHMVRVNAPSAFTFVSRPAASDEGVEDEGDPELPDTPEARTIFKHFCDVHGLHPDEAADSTGSLLVDLAALASPPVSERERELEGAISPVLSGVLTAFPTDEGAGDPEEVEVSFTRRQIKTLCAMFGVDPVTGEPV